ncbi:hypothetical protein [Nocardiopsis sp. NRRL B-16309]|uniref:hypothetical protein n=1 Tax=Nocardiopsis sp. NRRL B-16309 TaxID=1519494 RepID=UPI0006AF89A6|nr:hypothetical protein [Nocardiopsis sp. NRRL B-16309]KOX23607.1 hypothetical protein ADL05_02505 [Nocardiopsis sp. NRRL B-16309]
MPPAPHRLGASTLLTAAALGSVLLSPLPAAAAPAQHCVGDIDGGGQECFDSYEQAIGAAQDRVGRTLAEQERALAARERALSGSAPGTLAAASDFDVIIGTYFEHANYGGATFTLYGDNTCQGGDDIEFTYTFPSGWRNIISSAQPWARCSLWLHAGPDGTGDRDGPYRENTPDIGGYMNDRTVSTTLG